MSRIRQLVLPAAVAAALLVAGCGGSDEPEGEKLPQSVADTLSQQLDSISARVANGSAGACDDIYLSASEGGNIEPIDAALAAIPSGVDPEIRSALEQSVERLEQLVDDECSEIRDAERERLETVPDETTETETVPTETETTPTETETTPTETTPTPPVDEGGDEGGANGRGPDGDGPPGQQGGAEAPGGGDGD
jgi:outer membrane murein-binding lipoprotein Lpp